MQWLHHIKKSFLRSFSPSSGFNILSLSLLLGSLHIKGCGPYLTLHFILRYHLSVSEDKVWFPDSSLSEHAGSAAALYDLPSAENPQPNLQQQNTGTVNGKAAVSCYWPPLFACLILAELLVIRNFFSLPLYSTPKSKGRKSSQQMNSLFLSKIDYII